MNKNLPQILATSVIRSSKPGDSHGGIYWVNLETEEYKQVFDWNNPQISWEGRGGDRGLRGISFYNKNIYVAASDEIFVFNTDFKIIKSFKNRYLKNAHEICVLNNFLYIASTGFDSVLKFDLKKEDFVSGYMVRRPQCLWKRVANQLFNKLGYTKPVFVEFSVFNPNSTTGPEKKDTIHLNNVSATSGKPVFSGTRINHLMELSETKVIYKENIPEFTHNVQYGINEDEVLMNATKYDKIWLLKNNGKEIYDLPQYSEEQMLHTNISKDHARQAFGRGLTAFGDYIIAGSSPSTISVYKRGKSKPLKSIQLSKDIRNAIHGLEVYPY